MWDESFRSVDPISLNIDDVYLLLRVLASVSPTLRGRVKAVFDKIEKVPDDTIYVVPDFFGEEEVDLNMLIGQVAAFDPHDNAEIRTKDEQTRVLTKFFSIAGKQVRVRCDGRYGKNVADYVDTVPNDLVPLVVLVPAAGFDTPTLTWS